MYKVYKTILNFTVKSIKDIFSPKELGIIKSVSVGAEFALLNTRVVYKTPFIGVLNSSSGERPVLFVQGFFLALC